MKDQPKNQENKVKALKAELLKLQSWYDALKSRTAELEAHHESLQEKEIYLKSIETTIDSKSKLITDLTDQVDRLKDEQAYLIQAVDKTRLQVNKEQLAYNEKIKQIKLDTEESNNSLNKAKSQAHSQQKVLDSINKDIKERKKYAEEQEELLNSTIESGNKTLYDLKYDIADLENKKLDAEQQLTVAQSELSDYILLSDSTKNDLLNQSQMINEEISNKNQELLSLEKKLNKKQAEFVEMNSELDRKIMILKEYETKIKTLRETVVEERTALETEKRRWHSLKNLYDI